MVTKILRWSNSLGRLYTQVSGQRRRGYRGDGGGPQDLEGPPRRHTRVGSAYQLDTLLADVNPSNLHKEVEAGSPVGREAW